MPFLLMVLRPFALTFIVIQRFSLGSQNRCLETFGFQRRRVLRCECEMLLPKAGLRPVTSQMFAIDISVYRKKNETRTYVGLLDSSPAKRHGRAHGRGRTLRLRHGVERGELGVGCFLAAGLSGSPHLQDQAGHRRGAASRPHAHRCGDACRHAGSSFQRAGDSRARRFGTAGGGGLVRPPVQAPAGAHQRVCGDFAQSVPPRGILGV